MKFLVFARYHVGAKSHLTHIAEAQGTYHSHKFLIVVDLGKLCREAWRHNGHHIVGVVEHQLHVVGGLQKNLGALAAYDGAVAAAYAALVHHFGLAVLYADSFYRAFAYTGVTYPATVFYRKYQLLAFAVAHRGLCFSF